MIFEIPTLLTALYLLVTSESSLVTDSRDHKGIYMTEYCPKSPNCPEGSHVLCMYYNPRSIMGPRCGLPRNVTMTRVIANKVLEVINAFRSKIALGKETGKNGVPLPRAYSMFRVRWDNELATFAQVLANQCVLLHDLCRASKKFSDPGQTVGIVRFTFPNWGAISKKVQFPDNGLTLTKINYANIQSLKSWYNQKMFVTPDMIMNYPDWIKNPEKANARLFLEIISSSTTHMGCGMSAYTEYAYAINKTDLNYNSVQIVCNFSSRPHKGLPVYNTNPPTQVGYTIRCGCPEGFDEDSDCLCSENPKPPAPTRPCEGLNCKPAVVLLPIFTVEDPPPHKLVGRSGTNPNSIINQLSDFETESHTDNVIDIFKTSNEGLDNDVEMEELSSVISNSPLRSRPKIYDNVMENGYKEPRKNGQQMYSSPEPTLNQRIQPSNAYEHSQSKAMTVNDPHHETLFPSPYYSDSDTPKKASHPLKKSIFSKVHMFTLPRKTIFRDVRPDVSPRRDFSNSQKLLNDYLSKKRKRIGVSPVLTHVTSDVEPQPRINRKNMPHNISSNRTVNFNRYLRNKFHYQGLNSSNVPKNRFDIRGSNEESDKKLMDLLDNLEQEVKHIELDINEKEIFDAKIRKIYGSVVGKRPTTLNTKVRTVIPTNQAFKKRNSIKYSSVADAFDDEEKILDKKIFETEDRVKEATKLLDEYSDNEYTLRPLSRKVNTIQKDAKCGDKYPCPKKISSMRNTINMDDLKVRPNADEDKDYKIEDGIYKRLAVKRTPLYDDFIKYPHESRDNKQNREEGNLRRSYKDYDDEKTKRNKEILYEDPLSIDRRKFYHNKISNLERKMHDVRTNGRRSELQRDHTGELRMRPSRNGSPTRPRTKNQMSQFYIQDRARFLHGF